MKETKNDQPTGQGPANWFTGTVSIEGIRNPDEQSAIVEPAQLKFVELMQLLASI